MEAINTQFDVLTTLLLTLEKVREGGFKPPVAEGRVLSAVSERLLIDSYEDSLKKQIKEVQGNLNRAIVHALEKDSQG